MAQRTTLTGNGSWTQIGTGPATVQLVSDGVSVMVECAASAPTGIDGLILTGSGDSHTFQLSDAIWAQVVESGATAVVDVQPE